MSCLLTVDLNADGGAENISRSLFETLCFPSLAASDRCVSTSRHWIFTKTNVHRGSGHDGQRFKFVAGKRSAKFRFPEAAIRHQVLTTLCGLMPNETWLSDY
jgi:hypothetical protein